MKPSKGPASWRIYETVNPLLPALIIFTPVAFLLNYPLAKFVWATGVLLFLLKAGSVIRNNQLRMELPRGLGWALYLFAWPGMRPESFHQKAAEQTISPREFVQGFICFIAGFLLQAYLIYDWQLVHAEARLYLGLASFLLIVHFGVSVMLYTFYRLWGWPVEKLFHSPFAGDSLRDFWGKRWNLAFVDMDKRLFLVSTSSTCYERCARIEARNSPPTSGFSKNMTFSTFSIRVVISGTATPSN